MTIHTGMQLCWDCTVEVREHHGNTWVTLIDGDTRLTMEPSHVPGRSRARRNHGWWLSFGFVPA